MRRRPAFARGSRRSHGSHRARPARPAAPLTPTTGAASVRDVAAERSACCPGRTGLHGAHVIWATASREAARLRDKQGVAYQQWRLGARVAREHTPGSAVGTRFDRGSRQTRGRRLDGLRAAPLRRTGGGRRAATATRSRTAAAPCVRSRLAAAGSLLTRLVLPCAREQNGTWVDRLLSSSILKASQSTPSLCAGGGSQPARASLGAAGRAHRRR